MINIVQLHLTLLALSFGTGASAFTAASFVSSAAPSMVLVEEASAPSSIYAARHHAILHGYQPSGTALNARKKRGAAAVKGGKVQVKMLKYVEGTGRVGEVVSVSPAYWENKLKKTKSAVMITDDEVQAEKVEEDAARRASLEKANELKSKISEMEIIISKKSGPNGKLRYFFQTWVKCKL